MTPTQTLDFILKNYGYDILLEPRRIKAFFMDLCINPEYIQEVNILLLAFEMQIPSELLSHREADELRELTIVKRMTENYGIRKELTLKAIITWSNAIHNYNNKIPSCSIAILQRLASQGDANKQYELGKAYLKGNLLQSGYEEYIEKDLQKAFKNFSLSAKSKNSDAQNYVGYCYERGIGVNQDFKKAVQYYKKSAKQNNLHALYNIANCFEYGIGLEQNESKAFELYEELSKKGEADAKYKTAWFYENGIVVEEDIVRALELYKESAKQGSCQAQYYLGKCYQYGYHVNIDNVEAKNWYYLASKNNHSKAKKNLNELLISI